MNEIKVPFVNLGIQYETLRKEIIEKIDEISLQGAYIMSPEVTKFEENFAKLAGTKYALGVANGTDALFLVMKAWGIGEGDEVITAPNSFIASAGAIYNTGAKPVFCDIGDDFNLDPNLLEAKITENTKAIMPVHFTGMPAKMNEINAIAKKHNLKVIEDAAQAIDASYENKKVGNLGDAAGFSLHPLKNLHLAGDAGAITTNDENLYEQLKLWRNHGLKDRNTCEFFAYNSRLDSIQAGIGNIKLPLMKKYTDRFIALANSYTEKLNDVVETPIQHENIQGVFHNYFIQCDQRDDLMKFLSEEKGIQTAVHYPIPIHLQPAASYLGYKKGDFPVTEKVISRMISLPIYPELEDSDVEYICHSIKEYFNKN